MGIRIPPHITILLETLRYRIIVRQVLRNSIYHKLVVDLFYGLRCIGPKYAIPNIHGSQYFSGKQYGRKI